MLIADKSCDVCEKQIMDEEGGGKSKKNSLQYL